MTADMILPREGFVVDRLRARGAGPDALAARQRAERAAAAALSPPAGLGRSAILCVRALHSTGAKETLDCLLRGAARPALGPVPAAAPAVLFADTAELLACLAADWCAHTLAAHWWWQAMLRRTDGMRAVLRAWLGSAEYVPAALAHLARRGELSSFARALPPAAVRALLESLTRVFALGKLAAPAEALCTEARPTADVPPPRPARPEASRREEEPRASRTAGESVSHPSSDPGKTPPSPPWAGRVPESQAPGLTPPAQCLVALGLMLSRAPAEVRSRRFAEALRQWARARGTPTSPAAVPPATQSSAGDGAPGMAPAHYTPSATELTTPAPEEPPSAPFAAAPPAGAGLGQSPAFGPPVTVEPPPPGPTAPRSPGEMTSCAPPPPADESLVTEYGGVFYLINLALFLGLYGDFTSPALPGLELPIWDFLALLGERLAGPALRADPVWDLLARLAGRGPDEPPGQDFVPPDEDGDRPSLDDWLDQLLPHVSARLCLALGLASADGLAELLLAHRARVAVTATHLDITFDLAELPLAIRLAGLDRDPGWVPAAGRFIALHFE